MAQTPPIGLTHEAAVVRVACVGDSITYGSALQDRDVNAYPARLARLLGDSFEVANFGRPGSRISTFSPMCYMNTNEYRESLEFNPDAVVIALGINDCSVGEWQKNKDHFIQHYERLISSYQALETKPKIWLTALMPVMPPYEPYLAIQEHIRECQRLIEIVGRRCDVTVIDVFRPLNRQQRIYALDGLHPGAEGAAVIAETVRSALTGDFGGLALPYIFADRMVIQRDAPIRIFGRGNVDDVVEVRLSGLRGIATVDGNGRWSVQLPALNAGGPYTLKVSADREYSFSDVMVGEVWFCAGQSNMAMPLKSDANADSRIPLAEQYPHIRLLKRTASPGPAAGVYTDEQLAQITLDGYYSGNWQTCSSRQAKEFSAVGYSFAVELYEALGVPVGIIQNAVGGAPIEAFLPRKAFEKAELYTLTVDWLNADTPSWHRERARQNLSGWKDHDPQTLPHHPFEPTFLYYVDIEELIPYVIRGILWYQGESNATDVQTDTPWNFQANKDLFTSLINAWRSEWNLGDLPFYYVQLPNMNRSWMEYRHMQFEVLRDLPALGMAVTIDIGEADDVHPKQKYEVGRRLALWAKANVYGLPDIVCSGPLFRETEDVDGKLYLHFDFVGSGLTTSDGRGVKGIEIRDADGIWHSAVCHIDNERILIGSTDEKQVSAVRYAWRPNPDANLINRERLPASPFCFEIKP